MMGLNYKDITSNSVGYKTDFTMHSIDFEEFLWAKGYTEEHVNDLYQHLETLTPFSTVEMDVMNNLFLEYAVVGGMPAIVNQFIETDNFS